MEILAPTPSLGLETLLEGVRREALLEPFSEKILAFVREFSESILQDSITKELPELVALGYWLRPANIVSLKKQFEKDTSDNILKPRGIVLHFPPGNIDTMFIYSWILSLLVGNVNIIRISNINRNEIVNILLRKITSLFEKNDHVEIKKRTIIVSYGHDDLITKQLSTYCDVRIIWGGDHTIHSIRQTPIPARAIELTFADRFSYCALNAEAFLSLSDQKALHLSEKFANDAFWFSQLACSSPKAVIWIGNDISIERAKKTFWQHVEEVVHKKFNYLNHEPALVMRRYTNAMLYLAEHDAMSMTGPLQICPARIHFQRLTDDMKGQHDGLGLFLEVHFKNLQLALSSFTPKDQTLTYYGFSKAELILATHNLSSSALDRVIPIGEALSFSAIWDGFNLLKSLTRIIEVRFEKNQD